MFQLAMDENKQRFEALELENPKPIEGGKQDDEGDDDEEFDEEKEEEEEEDEGEGDEQRRLGELANSTSTPIGTESRGSKSEALASGSSDKLPESDIQPDFCASSRGLSEVPVEYSLQPLESVKFKDQIGATHQEVLAGVTAPATTQNQFQPPGCPTSLLESSPTSVTHPISSITSPSLREPKLSPVTNGNSQCVREADQQNSSHRNVSAVTIVKTSSSDGYNWRKYGQKQVKSPQGSRSYYRCTCSDCSAKKIECCDHSYHIVEIIYKGQHNHDPPRKINSTRESRPALSVAPTVGSSSLAQPLRTLGESDPSTTSKEPIEETIPVTKTKTQNSSSCDGNAEIDVEEEHFNEPEPKRRLKKGSLAYSGSLFKSGKKPRFVVHAAGDVGISGDGYRWRKYGQKMVKGNPHPRNYYRCTSAGCPVRKHIERAVDSTTAVIITYKGIHDHDMPVPKKRHGPPSVPLVAAAASASLTNSQVKKMEALQNQGAATKWSVGTEGELTGEALDLGGEKAMESARTLLSIGFEIKPC